MTTEPMRLEKGMMIDGEWLVEDVYWHAGCRIYILRPLDGSRRKYLDQQELKDMFMGTPVR